MTALFRVSQIKLHVRVRAASDRGIRRNEETCAYLQIVGKIINDHFSHYFKHARSIVFKGYWGGADLPNKLKQINKISKQGGGGG